MVGAEEGTCEQKFSSGTRRNNPGSLKEDYRPN